MFHSYVSLVNMLFLRLTFAATIACGSALFTLPWSCLCLSMNAWLLPSPASETTQSLGQTNKAVHCLSLSAFIQEVQRHEQGLKAKPSPLLVRLIRRRSLQISGLDKLTGSCVLPLCSNVLRCFTFLGGCSPGLCSCSTLSHRPCDKVVSGSCRIME